MTDINPNDLVVQDLSTRIADLTVQAASWRARAAILEQQLEDPTKADSEEEAQVG